VSEPNTVGLTIAGHQTLTALKHNPEDEHSGPFHQMKDAYLFSVSLALRCGKIAPESMATDKTFLNVGSLDPDRSVYEAVSLLRPDACQNEPVYRTVMRLAEAGLEELVERSVGGTIRFQQILEDLEAEEV
jgi:hypothetical protein